MSPVHVTVRRTIGRIRNLGSTAFAIGCFLSVAALLFASGIESAEGGRLSLSIIWASSVAPILPVLAALLAMDTWSEERLTGRIDLLLSVAVRERDFVLGKFIGVWVVLMLVVILALASSVALLWFFAPATLGGTGLTALFLAFLALAVQGLLWSAVSVMFSAMFTHAAAAACISVVALVVAPRAFWAGLMSWSPAGRISFGEMPLDAHVVDFASGLVPLGTVVAYLALTVLALFVAAKCVAAIRFVGSGAFPLRASTATSVVLASVLAVLAVLLTIRLNPTVDLSVASASSALSARTRSILAESSGRITATCFLPRSDVRFRSVGHLLRLFKRESESIGAARFELRFVDPRWDIGAAERLVRRGVEADSLVFEQGRRMVSIALKDGYGERLFASTIRRVAAPPRRRNVYWTVGHGESAFDAYGAFGLSDIARDLTQEGFSNATLDLAADQPIPGDCAMIVIAGARDDFSRVETGRLEAYLREGGRLLVLLGSAKAGGVVSMLPAWGIRPVDLPISGMKTLSGTDVIVSDFSDHVISAPLRGSRIVLERPVSFVPSAAVGAGVSADRIGFFPVAAVGANTVVAAMERGAGAGQDLALRPTRLVAIGDAGFVINGQLASRASANRDLFLNCVAYLSGSEAHGFGGDDADEFRSGLDRVGRGRLVVWSAVVVPGVVFLLMFGAIVRRMRRT